MTHYVQSSITCVAFCRLYHTPIYREDHANYQRAEFEYYRERFEMIVQDLAKYDIGKPIILEGAAYLPELVKEYAVNQQQVLYLVPTKGFQIHHYRQRAWIHPILKECDDPKQAFENWMMRDHLFGQEILRQAKENNYGTMLVDGRHSIDSQFEQVSLYFGLS